MVDDILNSLGQSFIFNKLRALKLHLSTEFVNKFVAVCRIVFVFTLGGTIGLFAWGNSSEIWQLVVLLGLPLIWGLSHSRLSAGVLMLGYYLVGARGLPGGIGVFFGNSAPWWSGWILWLFASLLLALPFMVLWSKYKARRRMIGFTVALCLSAIPPLGLIGWLNPLSVAGVLFPGCGWLGLVVSLGTMALLADGRANSLRLGVLFVGFALLANLLSPAWKLEPPVNWRAVDTRFSKLGSGSSDDASVILAANERVQWVERFLSTVPPNSVMVLPETILGPYGALSEWKLEEEVSKLSARGSRVVVGGELYVSDYRYKNALVVLGAKDGEDSEAVQGVPVPVSMWKPWADDGAVANIWGRDGQIEVLSKRASVVVCYEQFLLFSMLKAAVGKPDLLVGAANVWWIRDASMPMVQAQMMDAFGRLFGVPVIRARNF